MKKSKKMSTLSKVSVIILVLGIFAVASMLIINPTLTLRTVGESGNYSSSSIIETSKKPVAELPASPELSQETPTETQTSIISTGAKETPAVPQETPKTSEDNV
jgi:hypothetical protein